MFVLRENLTNIVKSRPRMVFKAPCEAWIRKGRPHWGVLGLCVGPCFRTLPAFSVHLPQTNFKILLRDLLKLS